MNHRGLAALLACGVALLALGGCAGTTDAAAEDDGEGVMTMPTGPVLPPVAAELGWDASAAPGTPMALPYFMHPAGCRCGMPWDRPDFSAKGLFNDTDPPLPVPPY